LRDSGDCDVILQAPPGHDDLPALLQAWLCRLRSDGFLTADLTLKGFWPGTKHDKNPGHSYMGLCKLPGYEWHRRIDLKIYSADNFAFALLYFTGSGHFNRSMRLLARQNGWRLSDKGLRKIIHDPQNKKNVLHEGPLVKCRTEHDIFKVMGLDYVEPSQRNGGANVTLADSEEEGAHVADSGEEDADEMQDWADVPVCTLTDERFATSHLGGPVAEFAMDRSDSPCVDSDGEDAKLGGVLVSGLQQDADFKLVEAILHRKEGKSKNGKEYDANGTDEDEEDSAGGAEDPGSTPSPAAGSWACQVPQPGGTTPQASCAIQV
jgi:hypothetical protein